MVFEGNEEGSSSLNEATLENAHLRTQSDLEIQLDYEFNLEVASSKIVNLENEAVIQNAAHSELERDDDRAILNRFALILPLCSGLSLPIISGLNRQLSGTLGNGLWAVGTNYFFCAVAATSLALFTAKKNPSRKEAVKGLAKYIEAKPIRLILLSGGLLGAIQNVHGSYAVHYIGPEVMSATALIGQIIFSIIFDATGIFWTRPMSIKY